MTTSNSPLRTSFQVLEVSEKSRYSVYRRILRTLGLWEADALEAFFTEFVAKAGLEVYSPAEDVDSVTDYENLLVKNQNIALWDDPVAGVVVAFTTAGETNVYHVGEMFLSLLDSFKLNVVRTFCPRPLYAEAYAKASCINSLNALLGLGYRCLPALPDGIGVYGPNGKSVRFETEVLSKLLREMIANSEISDISNPRWVFDMLQKWGTENTVVKV